jgi:hypothetical protein
MADNLFREKKAGINAFEVSGDDPMFLKPREFSFLFFSSSLPRVRLLFERHENYQQGAIQFCELTFTATDYLKRPCICCQKAITTVDDCCLAINQKQVVAVVHESCFNKWINASDKGKISPYRLLRTKRQKLSVSGGSFKVQINGGTPVDEYTFTELLPIESKDVAASITMGTIVQQPSGGFTGTPPQGVQADDYVAQMKTMIQSESPREEPKAKTSIEWGAGSKEPPSQSSSGYENNSIVNNRQASVSHSMKVKLTCPHCNQRLVLSIDPE